MVVVKASAYALLTRSLPAFSNSLLQLGMEKVFPPCGFDTASIFD
jgi:hypothetical protein